MATRPVRNVRRSSQRKAATAPPATPLRPTQQVIADRLAAIADRNAGRLTPDDVIEDAKDPKSPLHGYFEWNDAKAAHAHRLEQARALIRSVKVIIETETTFIRAVGYVVDPTRRGDEQGYVRLESIVSEAALARKTLMTEAERVLGVLRRAEAIAAVLGLEEQLANVVGVVRDFHNTIAKAG